MLTFLIVLYITIGLIVAVIAGTVFIGSTIVLALWNRDKNYNKDEIEATKIWVRVSWSTTIRSFLWPWLIFRGVRALIRQAKSAWE